MLPEMTPAVVRALESGQSRARSMESPEVGIREVLAGLLEEEEGQAATLALAAGLDLPAYLASLPPVPPESAGRPLPLARALEAALRAARSLARQLSGEATVHGEALLLALAQTDEGAASLVHFGLQPTHLEAHLEGSQEVAPSLPETLQLAEVTERVDTARILDAAGNRAREALRVVEDYCRFALDDAFLSGLVKGIRHDLAGALAELSPEELNQARETLRDVGTGISTANELQRTSLIEVARINLKRLQEALRSLEEFGKMCHPLLGEALEQLRYRSYTLERALVLGASARARLRDARLYVLLSGAGCLAALDWTIAEAADGGASIVQLREKDLSDRELLERARQVRQWTRKAGVLFILNDRPDLARLVEADGVHLGQDDLPVKEARRVLGPDALIGVSTHDIGQLRQAILDGASYLGVGPTFPSRTKEFSDFPGLDLLRQAVAETTLPVFAIGGINLDTIDAVVAAGGRRVAVSHVISGAEDPRRNANILNQALAQS